MTRQTKNIFARIALTLTSAFKTTIKPLSPSSKTPPSLKRTAAQPSFKDTAENPVSEPSPPDKPTLVATGTWERTLPLDHILRQITIWFDLEDGGALHLTVDKDSAALMAKSILDHLNRSSEPPRLSAPGKTILCSGRFEMNDHGEILLDPVFGENPEGFFWSSGPNEHSHPRCVPAFRDLGPVPFPSHHRHPGQGSAGLPETRNP